MLECIKMLLDGGARIHFEINQTSIDIIASTEKRAKEIEQYKHTKK